MDTDLALDTGKDELTSYFDKSAATVRDTLQRLEHEVTRPLIQYVLESYHQHPIRSTYLTILAALSFVPALSFVGFALFISTSFVCTALTAALVAATVVIALFGLLFLGTLFLLVGVSIFLTASTLGTYLLIRLASHTYDAGPRVGIVEWANESRTQLLPSRFHPIQPDPTGAKPKAEQEGPSHDDLVAQKYSLKNIAGSQQDGLGRDGAVGADLGSPPTVAKSELEKE